MSIPSNFNAFEHLQDTYRVEFNRKVDRYFKDVTGEGDLNSPRGNLKLACRLLDSDNAAMMQMRASLFFDVIGASKKGLAVVLGESWDTAPPVVGHPQLFLVFSQDPSSVPEGGTPLIKEKTARLMKFSTTSEGAFPAITRAICQDIANEIKAEFFDGAKAITYTAGNLSASYSDPDNGFPRGNYMLVNSKPDATKIYSRICKVLDVPYRGDGQVIVNDPDRPSETAATADTITVMGKTQKTAPYRPVAVMRFRRAYIGLGSRIKPIHLIDTTLQYQGLVKYPW